MEHHHPCILFVHLINLFTFIPASGLGPFIYSYCSMFSVKLKPNPAPEILDIVIVSGDIVIFDKREHSFSFRPMCVENIVECMLLCVHMHYSLCTGRACEGF